MSASISTFLLSVLFYLLDEGPCSANVQSAVDEKAKENGSKHPKENLFDLPLSDLINIKVTAASLIKQDEFSVGSAVSAIDESEWKTQGIRQVLEPLERVPGVMVFPNFGGPPTLAIRGFGRSSASVRGVATLLDGVPINILSAGTATYTTGNINLGILQRIELIRGTGSTIYGTDAFHGVVSMQSWTSDKDRYEGEAGYGSFTSYQANFRASKALSSDLRLTLLGGVSGQGGIYMPYQAVAPSGKWVNWIEKRQFDSETFIAKLDYRKSFQVSLYHSRYSADSWPAIRLIDQVSNSPVQAGRLSNLSILKVLHTVPLSKSMSWDTNVYYWINFGNDHEKLLDLDKYVKAPEFTEQRAGIYGLLKREKTTDFPLQILSGFSFSWRDTTNAIFTNAQDQAFDEPFSGKSLNVLGLILQTDTSLTDSFQLLLGGRYDIYSTHFGNHFSPRAGFIFHLSEDSAIKLLYGHAFRVPTSVETYGVASVNLIQNPDLIPETIDTIELLYLNRGKKYSFSTGLFRSDWSNAILLSPHLRYENSARNYSYGAEFDMKYRPYVLGGFISGSYIRSTEVSDLRSSDYSGFPKLLLNWGLEYRWPKAKLKFEMFNRHQWFRTTTSMDTSPALGPYFRTDFAMTWDPSSVFGIRSAQFELTGSVRNLLNRQNFQPSNWNLPGGFEEPGRSAVLMARIHF